MFDYIFKKKLFTKVFWKLQDAKTRFVINYGGTNSSKSWSQAQHEIIDLISRKKGDTLVMRKIAADMKKSVYKQIQDIIISWEMEGDFKFTYSGDNREIKHKAGNTFVFKGADDVEKLKSMVGIKRVWMEEMNQFTRDDLSEITRRARGIGEKQTTGTFNPILETSWIKHHFFEIPEIKGRTTFIHSTIDDNPFATEDDWEDVEMIKLYSQEEYKVYRYGLWGKTGVERPFAFAFKDHHIGHGLTHNPKLTVYLSFDFNVDPITCIAVQNGYTKDDLWIKVIKEFRLPESDIYALCKEIRTYFYETIYFKITGDATGKARTAMTKGHTNYYLIIKSELRLTNANFDVPTGNPSVKNTRVLMNTLFMRTDFLIDDSCKYLIDDLHYVEVNEHGDIDKIKAEKEGMNHLLDCLRYYCYRYHNRYLKFAPKKLVS